MTLILSSLKTGFLAGLLALAVGFMAHSAQAAKLDPENTIYLDVKYGRVVIALRPDLAPEHVKRIKTLAREKFYDGVKFHRVIAGFMAQTGDPTGTGRGGSDYHDLKAEFSEKAKFERGTLGMARAQHPDSANSQFFICFDKAYFLNRKYTIFGQVVEGMEFVDRIKKGAPRSGMVDNPDIIVRMRVAADVK
jgi:peptidylprolyl isomerase